jgi:hypothetical protein
MNLVILERLLDMAHYRSPAMPAYLRRLAILMAMYLVTFFLAATAFRHGWVSGWWVWPLAVLPALPIIGIFWAVMRLVVEEPDEYVRMLFVRQCMIATGFCLVVMTIWQFLRNFDLVPQGDGGFGATFVWFVGLGVGAIFNWLTIFRLSGKIEANDQ